MKLMSLNVGQPRVVETARGEMLTAIFKEPVEDRRKIVPHNVEGDQQADLTVHGGPRKAVYGYAWEHYAFWRTELKDEPVTPGMFGENLTVSGLDEKTLHIGDVVAVGTAKLRVTEPRMPCVKLAVRFNRADMVRRFWQSGRSGVYFSVEQAGDVGSGDSVAVVEEHPLKVTVSEIVDLYSGASRDEALYQRAMASPLQGGWRRGIEERWTEMS